MKCKYYVRVTFDDGSECTLSVYANTVNEALCQALDIDNAVKTELV